MTPIPGVYIECLHSPSAYTSRQLDQVCQIAALLNRGRFLLLEPPQR